MERNLLIMKKLFKMLSAAASGIFAAAMMAVTVSAQDYEFDVASATISSGEWGQAFTEYTSNLPDSEYSGGFDPAWLTESSEIIVEYTYTGTPNTYPCELIWQTWGDEVLAENPDINSLWNQIAPAEYDDKHAVFKYADIVEKYGTKDFSKVYAINIGDCGVQLKVTKVTATNVDMPEQAVSETEAAEETGATVTTNIAENAPDEGSALPTVLLVVGIVAAAAVVVVIIVMIIKKNSGKMY